MLNPLEETNPIFVSAGQNGRKKFTCLKYENGLVILIIMIVLFLL